MLFQLHSILHQDLSFKWTNIYPKQGHLKDNKVPNEDYQLVWYNIFLNYNVFDMETRSYEHVYRRATYKVLVYEHAIPPQSSDISDNWPNQFCMSFIPSQISDAWWYSNKTIHCVFALEGNMKLMPLVITILIVITSSLLNFNVLCQS